MLVRPADLYTPQIEPFDYCIAMARQILLKTDERICYPELDTGKRLAFNLSELQFKS